MTKLYFYGKYSDRPYTKDIIINTMRDQGITSREVYKAVRSHGSGMFYCKEYQTAGDIGDCNSLCNYYSPRNKKSGICKHHGCMYDHGEKVIIKIK